MFSDEDKEGLLEKWNCVDVETKRNLIFTYLLEMNTGQGQTGWLIFLNNQFDTDLCTQRKSFAF